MIELKLSPAESDLLLDYLEDIIEANDHSIETLQLLRATRDNLMSKILDYHATP